MNTPFASLYTNFIGYLWAVVLCVVVFFAMKVCLKNVISGVTKLIYKGENKNRSTANTIIGGLFCAVLAYIIGSVVAWGTGTEISSVFFVLGGLLAHYVYLIIYKTKTADQVEYAKTDEVAMRVSDAKTDGVTLSEITAAKAKTIAAYECSKKSAHGSLVNNIARGMTDALDISAEDEATLKDAVNAIKSAGIDVTSIEAAIKAAKADGHFTEAEKLAIEAELKKLREAIGL